MLVTVSCPVEVFSGPDTHPCGRAIELDVSIPPLALVTAADTAEIPLQCKDGHRFDQEDIADIRQQINAAVDEMENREPVEEFEFPGIADPFFADDDMSAA